MSKKVLMTNLYLQKYTGSELHTLELARQFKKALSQQMVDF